MKFSIKISNSTLVAMKGAEELIKRAVVARDGIPLDTPEVKETEKSPSKEVTVQIGEFQMEMEFSPEELPAIYRECGPMFKDLMSTVLDIKKMKILSK